MTAKVGAATAHDCPSNVSPRRIAGLRGIGATGAIEGTGRAGGGIGAGAVHPPATSDTTPNMENHACGLMRPMVPHVRGSAAP
jgi:hypothetical protein